jgi:dipeptidyl aminopeptidase/acylaminoacyl peptidase
MQIHRQKSAAALAAVLITSLLSFGASADSPQNARTAELVTRLLQQYQLSDTRFASDGSRAAFVASEPIAGQKSKSSIWMYEEKAGAVRKLTAGERDSQPRWSSDNATLALLSERGGATAQIYLLPLAGGEARQLTNAPGGVDSFEWSPAGGQLAYLGTDPAPESADKDKGDDEIVGSIEHGPTRLMVVDVDSGKSRRVILGDEWAVAQFAWLPHGRQIVVTATDRFLPEAVIDRLFVVSVEDGTVQEIGRIASRGIALELCNQSFHIGPIRSLDGAVGHGFALAQGETRF